MKDDDDEKAMDVKETDERSVDRAQKVEPAVEFFKRRARGGDLQDLKQFLRAVPDVPPMPGDELP